MNRTQKQTLIDINNIAFKLDHESQEKMKKVAISLLDIKLLEVMPQLSLSELDELDPTEKLMLLEEFSKTEEERKKEKEEAIPLDEILKEEGLK